VHRTSDDGCQSSAFAVADHDVLAAYRKTGSGWQTRINADLRKAARKLAG